MNNTYFYKDKPIFGLDIGFSSLKVMQINLKAKRHIIEGYGAADFDSSAIERGVIVQPELIAKVAKELFTKNIIGEITTRRVSIAIPSSQTFTRTIKLPKMNAKDLTEAVQLEAEQYIPVPLSELYLDFSVISTNEKEIELLSIAVPKKIVDSYVLLTNLLGLELVSLETTIVSSARLFVQAEKSDVPTVLIDFGSISSDISIYDETLIVTGTVPGGGDSFTDIISKSLNVGIPEAHLIKTKYGLGVSKKQKELTIALTPLLEQLTKELRRMIRYYEERNTTHRKIAQIVTIGGGANMPGLSEYMTNQLRLPVRMCDPWQHLDFYGLQPPNTSEKSIYITVAGLALISQKEMISHD